MDEEAVRVNRGQAVPGRKRNYELAMTDRRCASRNNETAIWGLREGGMPRSISPASREPSGLTSTPSDGATVWIAANSPVPLWSHHELPLPASRGARPL